MEKQVNYYINFFLKNNKLRSFVLFLLISMLLWFFSQLSNTYNYDITIPVKYLNSQNQILPDNFNKDTLLINVKTSGYSLLKIKLKKPILYFKLKNLDKNNNWYPSDYKNKIINLLNDDVKIISISPPQIQLVDKDIMQKTVLIKTNIKIRYKKGFGGKGKPEIYPEKIKIFGRKNVLSTVNQINTENINIENVDYDIHKKIKLIIPKDVKTTQQEIDFKQKTDEITELWKEIKIIKPTNLKNKEIIFFPEKAKVKFLIFKSDYQALKNKKIFLIPKIEKQTDTTAILKFEEPLKKVISYQIIPSKVNILIKEKK